MYTQNDFSQLKDIILKDVPSTTSIILFGSYAKGNAREDSDIDIAILTDREFARGEKLKALAELRWDTSLKGYNVDFILSNQRVFLLRRSLPTLAKIILQEGKYLWIKN
jgi:predicted nucleotidyltransferase